MKQLSLRFLCAATALGLVSTGAVTRMSAATDVHGRISSQDGMAVEGATVFVFTAAPKTGTSPFCPSCYPDCGKSARADVEGRFTLPALSSELVFRLLVVAKGYTPQYVPNIEPSSRSIEVALVPRQSTLSAGQVARGRIVDPDGAPIFGAVVEVEGVDLGDGRRGFGRLAGLEPLAVSDENGEFVTIAGTAVAAILGRVTARTFANQTVNLATGQQHTIKMTVGSTLTGRVLKDGKPLPNVSLGVSPHERSAGSFVGHFEVGTDASGRFTFLNLPPRTDYYIYGLMATLGVHGVLPKRSVHVGHDGETTDVGDLKVREGFRLSGRVVLEDGSNFPPNTRLLIGRDQVWDSTPIALNPEGDFDISGLEGDVVTLSVRLPGYQISPKNKSYDPANRRLVGRIERDVVGFEMLMEKGSPPLGMISAASLPRWKPGEHPRERPLTGVESGR